ncbi:hypothetical protein LR48_Vigan11g040200 [Vigna angularis]|uniref:Uncharacterized protein n=1 Tax=Phaseolus angularis TaxID=3914 RepID=A0A0L9VRI1_PHAAN|nr:hypothetical protein LR48_Vigan11g040200 [Vigna angularis]
MVFKLLDWLQGSTPHEAPRPHHLKAHGDGAYAETVARQSPAALEELTALEKLCPIVKEATEKVSSKEALTLIVENPLCFHSLHDDMQAPIHVEGISRVSIPATINKLFSYGKEKHPAVHTHHIKRKKIVQSCNEAPRPHHLKAHGDGAYAETVARQSPAALEELTALEKLCPIVKEATEKVSSKEALTLIVENPLCFHSLHDDMQAPIHVEGISRVSIPATINKLFSYGKEKHPAVHTHHIKRKKIVQSCNG